MYKAVIGIQCRFSSSRLPGKALMPLGETTLLGAVILRCLSTNLDTYVLTSTEKSDDKIKSYSEGFPIKGVLRGPLNNVQQRYRSLALKTGSKFIIRVTADNPFTDSNGILKLLEFSSTNNIQYARYSNNELPIGFHSECFMSDELFKIENQNSPSDEHVTYTMRKNSNYSSISGLGYNLSEKTLDLLHCTVDNLDDYKKALHLQRKISMSDFSSLNLIHKLI